MKSSSRALQRQIDLATAVCQERLLATHVRHVIAFVDLVADQMPFDDALDIYVRVLRLTPEQARNVGSRSLAEIGRRDREAGAPVRRQVSALEAEEREEEAGRPETTGGRADALFGRLRKRIRGRVQEDLRHRINLAAARTEDDLLEAHVGNALIFVRALANELNESEAVERYLDTMMLPEGVGDVIYHRALRRIADQVLPRIADEEAKGAVESTGLDIRAHAREAQA